MNYRALFIGLTTIDIQYFVEIFPKSNVKIKTNPPQLFVGGPATNAAVAFSHLNKGAFLATPCGNNTFSLFIENDFHSSGITHFDLAKNQNFNPVLASVITSWKNGDRNIFTHNPDLNQFDYSAEELFEIVKPEIILLDGFYPEFALKCAKIAQNNGIPVVIDCGSWKPQYKDLLEFTDIVICSEDFYPPQCKNSDQVIQFIQEKKVEKVAISRGWKSILHQDKNRGEVSIEKIKVVDTLGAGDFFHGAFCYYYLQQKDFKIALKKASLIASYSCKFEGTRLWLNNGNE